MDIYVEYRVTHIFGKRIHAEYMIRPVLFNSTGIPQSFPVSCNAPMGATYSDLIDSIYSYIEHADKKSAIIYYNADTDEFVSRCPYCEGERAL